MSQENVKTEAEETETTGKKEQAESLENDLYPDKDEKKVEDESKAGDEKKDEVDSGKKEETDSKEKTKEDFSVEFKEGSLLAESDRESIASEIKERGLSKEDAEKLVESREKLITDFVDRETQAQNKIIEQAEAKWIEEGKNHKEIGGEVYEKIQGRVEDVVKKYGGEYHEQIMSGLKNTGYINHPGFLVMLNRFYKDMNGGKEVPTGNAVKPKSDGDVFYPDMD